ncbi:hypothetical protein BY458DRAFT_523288 [Sporodiniella umbellata]|nr:hypothetical protein BY458DRAFT_523288 [Sporodiniella umbellata]
MSGGNIKVVVRCRPLNSREKARGAIPLIQMEGNKTIITKPATQGQKSASEEVKAFTFDQSYWSADLNSPDYADQIRVYNDLGKELLDHAFDGYNCCIFAYGQTGSGKSYSMVGYGEDKGIIPRTCSELFERVQQNKTDTLDFRVEVSYIEIYNEKVKDLLNPSNKANLKVREHPVLGPYVQDLSRLAVSSFEDIDQLMDEGNKARTVAATQMNATSSRSHAVCTIFVTQRITDSSTKQTAEKVARISLVDLAGSERANSTGATGARLKEGANINKSLTTLGKVIAGLAEQASGDTKKGSKKSKDASHIPFRDSVLTWLLKDSLGGNSKTCMIAAISPADYDETLSTLRYADQAKKIKTKAVVNEDPSARVMRELKDEVEALRQALMVYNPAQVEKITANVKKTPAKTKKSSPAENKPTPVVFTDGAGKITQLTKDEMVEQLENTQKLLGDISQPWEEKVENTKVIQRLREDTLKSLGIAVEKNQVGLYTPREIPHLINLNEDPLMNECLMYNLKPGTTLVDRADDANRETGVCVIRLSGENIENGHCRFENTEDAVTLYPREGCTTMVNGLRISEPKKLKSGYRIILGDAHVFRFNNPGEARKERDHMILSESQSKLDGRGTPSPIPSQGEGESSATVLSEVMDWNFARKEAIMNTYINDAKLNHFSDQDLDKLFDEVARVRVERKRQSVGSESLSRHSSSSSSVRRSVYSAFLDDDGYYTTDSSTTLSSLAGDDLLHLDSKHAREFQHQRRKYEARLRRLSHRISSGSTSLTSVDTALAKKVIAHWRRQRNVAIAQAILKNDIYVRQANHLAQTEGKDVFYQFAIVYQDESLTASHRETSHHRHYGIDSELLKAQGPCVGIQVIDYKHQSTYVWSIDRFVTRLRHLQGIRFVTDSKKHLKGDDLFFSQDPASYVLVGLAKIPLKNLATEVSVQSHLSVHCRTTGRYMGQLKVDILPIARSVQDPVSSEDPCDLLHNGQQLMCEVSILEMTGLDPNLFSRVHAQFRLSNFGQDLQGVHASDSQENKEGKPIQFDFHQLLSLSVTQELLAVIHHGEIVFEVYGKPKPAYLDSLKIVDSLAPKETLMPAKKSMDVLATFQVCEMTPEGDYTPVPVEFSENCPVFSLQQGQQRRLVLNLEQSSLDAELGLERIVDVRLGRVRLINDKKEVVNSPESAQAEIHLKMVDSKRHSQTKEPTRLKAECSWDSSLHDTLLLNAVTQNSHQVLLDLCWTVRNASMREFKFTSEIAVHIKDQTKAAVMKKKRVASQNRRTSLLNFFSKPNQIRNQLTCIYVVEYDAELFGIQEADQQNLPLTLLAFYEGHRQKMLYREEVEATRYRLFLNEQLDRTCKQASLSVQPDLETILKLWMAKKQKKTPQVVMTVSTPSVRRWSPHVHQILINEQTVAKKGFLQRKNDTEGKDWDKLWCVLVGNYMFMYDDPSEVNQIDVIHIKNVHKEDGNAMKSKTIFTIDSLQTSHKLQAQDNATMLKWVEAVDKLTHHYG